MSTARKKAAETFADANAVVNIGTAAPKRRRADKLQKSAIPPRKPMAMTHRVSLFQRSVQVRLAPAAMDILMDGAKVLSEGELLGRRYAGSTMVTIDLLKSAAKVSDPLTRVTADRVAGLHAEDDRARGKARKLANAEARRLAKCELTLPQIDVEARAVGSQLHLSINVEADRKEGPLV
jgi:hypothetical protein